MVQFKVLQASKLLAVVGVVLAVFFVGNASAGGGICSQAHFIQHEFSIWTPPPPDGASTFLTGPGAGTEDPSLAGYGSLGVFDAPILGGPVQANATEYGRDRGMFLVDGKDGKNIIIFQTFCLTNHSLKGCIVSGGDMPLNGEVVTLPILGGTEDFACGEGFVRLNPSGTPPGKQLINALYRSDVIITVPKSKPTFPKSKSTVPKSRTIG